LLGKGRRFVSYATVLPSASMIFLFYCSGVIVLYASYGHHFRGYYARLFVFTGESDAKF